MKTPPTPRAKLARARVAYLVSGEMFYPVKPKGEKSTVHVIIDCPTRAQAARIAKVANMSEGERVVMVAKALFLVEWGPAWKWEQVALSVHDKLCQKARITLSALGLATGGKA